MERTDDKTEDRTEDRTEGRTKAKARHDIIVFECLNVIISSYQNTLITRTEIYPFCILRTSSDTIRIVVSTILTTHSDLREKKHVLQICSYLGLQDVPSHVLSAVEVIFHD